MITTLTAMAALHPYEYAYFNALVDTRTPGALAERYDMDHWRMARWQLLKHLLARYPDDDLRVWPTLRSALLLPQKDRNRLIGFGNSPAVDFYSGIDLLASVGEKNVHAADFYLMDDARGRRILRRNIPHFYLHPRVNARDIPKRPPIEVIRAYGSALTYVVAKDVDAYRAAYDDIAANRDLLARADFGVYIQNDALYYLNADCAPRLANADARIFLHIFSTAAADLPADSREFGFENLDFRLIGHNLAFFDGKCIYKQPLPDYPIARIRTGQNAADGASGGKAMWQVDINLAARVAIQAVYERIAAGDYGSPIAQSRFALYLRDNTLAYIKEPCAAGDTDARFFLHIVPANPADLPMGRRERGFENLDFQFSEHGAYAGDKCVVTRELPDYPIERIRTGQFVSGAGRVWGVEFPVGR